MTESCHKTAESSGTTVYSEKVEMNSQWLSSPPLAFFMRVVPSTILPLSSRAPRSHRVGLPRWHHWQVPQAGRKVRITWSPG